MVLNLLVLILLPAQLLLLPLLTHHTHSITHSRGETTFPYADENIVVEGSARALAQLDSSESMGLTDGVGLVNGTLFSRGRGGISGEGTYGRMGECSKGLRVKPVAGGGALFYHKFGNGTNDEQSMHGGCPPGEGSVAWKINGFMWNTDADRGPTFFR